MLHDHNKRKTEQAKFCQSIAVNAIIFFHTILIFNLGTGRQLLSQPMYLSSYVLLLIVLRGVMNLLIVTIKKTLI